MPGRQLIASSAKEKGHKDENAEKGEISNSRYEYISVYDEKKLRMLCVVLAPV